MTRLYQRPHINFKYLINYNNLIEYKMYTTEQFKFKTFNNKLIKCTFF